MGMFVRRNGRVGTLIFAVLLLATPLIFREVSAQQLPTKPADRITGVVINSVTGEPVARALVVSEGEIFATLTDNSGRFEFVFPDTPGGQSAGEPGRPPRVSSRYVYRPSLLTARKPGFLNGRDEHASPGQRVIDGKEMEIALVPEALIVGHIALPTTEPPDPIEVELFQRQVRNGRAHWVSVGVQSTRSDGQFRFAELPAGTYKLLTHELRDEDPKFSAPEGQVYGYAPVYYPNASGFSSAGTIELKPGKTAEASLKLTRQPYFPVIVPVTNVPPGRSLGGIEVSVQGPGGPGYALQYDYQKQAIVGLLPNGSYQLRAMNYGQQALSGDANITVHGGANGAILPLAATPPVRVNVKDEFTSEVSPFTTTIVGSNGRQTTQERRFDVTVALQPVDDFTVLQQGTPSQGHLDPQTNSMQIDSVAPGRYWVEVYPTNGYAASVTAGGVDLRNHPLVVPSGSSAPSIEIVLRNDTASIEGTVEGVSNLSGVAAPVPTGFNSWSNTSSDSSARLYFIPLPDSTGRFIEQNVSQDGSFSVSLPPGEYRVLAFPRVQPEIEYENPNAMRAYDGKGQVVRLAAGQKERIQLQLISTSE